MKKLFFLLFVTAFIFIARPAQAIYFGSGEKLSFPKTQKFNETVFVAASDLVIDADIDGDLLCAGQNVTINSKITGDLLCASQNIIINGSIDGNVRVIGQQIGLNGSVGRNLSVAGQTLGLSQNSSVKGDIYYGVQNVTLQGSVGRDLAGGSESVKISGTLLRNAKLASNSITVADTAKLGGELEYYVEKTGSVSINEKSIKGKVIRHEVEMKEKNQISNDLKKITPAVKAFQIFASLVSSIFLVILLLYFVPVRVSQVGQIVKSHPVKSALVGLAVLVTTPIAILISCLTVVGLSLGVIITLFYIICLMLASSFVLIQMGEFLSQRLNWQNKSIYLSSILSCLVFGLFFHIPVVGPIVGLTVFLVGLGATFLSYLPAEK